MDEFTISMSSIVFPLPLIGCTIGPLLQPLSIPKTAFPFTNVACTRLEPVKPSTFSWSIGIEHLVLLNGLRRFRQREVLAI